MSTNKEIFNKIKESCPFDITEYQIKTILESAMETIKDEVLTEGECKFMGMFKITKTRSKARAGRNPHTKETIQIPAKDRIKVKALKKLSSIVSN